MLLIITMLFPLMVRITAIKQHEKVDRPLSGVMRLECNFRTLISDRS